MIRRRRAASVVLALAVVGAFCLAGCAAGPAGDLRAHEFILRELGGPHRRDGLQGLLDRVVARLAPYAVIAHADAPAWRAYVVDDPSPNAYALPDGRLYFSRGLFAALNSEAELAHVVGHEMGHVVARHGAAIELVGALGRAGRTAAVLAGVDRRSAAELERLTVSAFSRSQENEADALGFSYAVRAGYDPAAASAPHQTFLRLKRYRERVADEEPGYSVYDTHPPSPERIATLEDLAQAQAPDAAAGGRRPVEDAAYLALLHGLGWGRDLAAGYAQGREFLHPQLGARFTVPEGYRLSLDERRVAAENPASGGLILFDAAPLGPPMAGNAPEAAAYLSGLWASAGGIDGVRTRRIAGWPAASGEVRVATAQGERRGWAAAAIDAANGRALRFVCLYGGDADECRRLFGSVAPAGQQDWRRRPAARIHVVEASPGERMANVAARAGWIPQAEILLRALNGLGDGEEPPPGRKLKLIEAD